MSFSDCMSVTRSGAAPDSMFKVNLVTRNKFPLIYSRKVEYC